MIARALLAVAMSGCSLVFPLPDEPSGDGGLPSNCPAPGTAPAFGSGARTIVTTQLCTQYTTSTAAGLGVGACRNIDGVLGVFDGPIDEPPQPASIQLKRTALHSAVIDPEGTRLITVESTDNVIFAIETYVRNGSAWVHRKETMLTSQVQAGSYTLGTPTRSPRQLLLFERTMGTVLQYGEIEDAWILDRSFASPFGALQPNAAAGLHLTPNGLGVVFATNQDSPAKQQLGYADRATTSDDFGPAQPIPLLASTLFNDVSLGNDCEKVYLAEATGIAYVTN